MKKGILIALIIAILVLLIIAVVIIGVVKENSIIENPQNLLENKDADLDENNPENGLITVKSTTAVTGDRENTVIPVARVDEIVNQNSTINGKAYSSSNPVIPKGFKAINVTTEGHESYWDAEGGPEVSEGLVISDGTSEFVWIPVKDGILPSVTGSEPVVMVNGNFKQYDNDSSKLVKIGMPENSTADDFLNQLTNKYNIMKLSVKKYEGFYVGRYETSMNGSKTQSKSGEIPMNSVDWYTMYRNSQTYSTSGVISEMIWGSQWEAMMDFIGIEEASKIGRVSHNLSSPYLTGNGEGEGQYSSTVKYNDVINNIYDLEGNVREWTQEKPNNGFGRVMRGGDYFDDDLPSYRCGFLPDQNSGGVGSRLALYVEL